MYGRTLGARCHKLMSGKEEFYERVKRKNIVRIEIKQNILQKLNGKCNIFFMFCGETRSNYGVKAVYLRDVHKLIKILKCSI